MEENKLIESKKILTDYMLELNNDIQSAEDWANTGADEEMYFALQTVLDELERLQKENALNFEKTVQNSKLKYLINSNLEKTEDGEYIVDSNACQTLVRHLIRIVDNEEYDVTCLHCGNDTPLYCEKCQQELISKNAELQMKYEKINKFLHSNSFVFQNENGDIQGMLLTPENFIPKQVVRNKIEEVNKEYKKYTEKWEKLGMNKEHPFYRYIVRLEAQIDILEELLNEVN